MTAPSTGAVGDARKRDQETHWDPAVRALIAEAVQAERERIAAAIRRDHAVPFGSDANRGWDYRNGYYDGAMHAARVARDGGR